MTSSANIGLTLISTLFLFLLSGWLFCSLNALVFRILEAGSGKTFYNLLARQLTACGLLLSFLPAAALALALVQGLKAGLFDSGLHGCKLALEPSGAVFLALGAIILFIIIQSLSLWTWKRLRKNAPLQILAAFTVFGLSVIGVGLSWVLLASTLPSVLSGLGGAELPAAGLPSAVFLLRDSTPAQLFCLGLGAGMWALGLAVSACWLLLRRNRDDFGRDYYNFALNRVARFALALTAGSVVFIVAGAWFLRDIPANGLFLPWHLGLAAAALQVVCLAVWFLTVRSDFPLRLKAGHWSGLALMTCSLFLLLLQGQAWARLVLAS